MSCSTDAFRNAISTSLQAKDTLIRDAQRRGRALANREQRRGRSASRVRKMCVCDDGIEDEPDIKENVFVNH